MTNKDDLRKEVDELKSQSTDSGIVMGFDHPDNEALYDRHKERVDMNKPGLAIVLPWKMSPFVVERDEAEANGWDIKTTVETGSEYYSDLVEVSEWCINPWVGNPDDRTVINR